MRTTPCGELAAEAASPLCMAERLRQLLGHLPVVVLCAAMVGGVRQHALEPAGPQAARVAGSYWVVFGVATRLLGEYSGPDSGTCGRRW